jgi:hypothetical protein
MDRNRDDKAVDGLEKRGYDPSEIVSDRNPGSGHSGETDSQQSSSESGRQGSDSGGESGRK